MSDTNEKDAEQAAPEDPKAETPKEDAPKTEVPPAASADASQGMGAGGDDAESPLNNFQDKATEQLGRVFPGHATEAFWACVGFVCALLILWIGFWQTLVIVLFVIAGVAFGQYLEGDPKILNAVKGWFDDGQKKS